MDKLVGIISILRPKQYVKNFFIFLPVFFDKQLFDLKVFSLSLVAFLAFCFVASSVYCINDILDIESDRKHPEKKFRPLPSGLISVRQAIFLMLTTFIAAVCISISLDTYASNDILNVKSVSFIIVSYFVLNLGYSFKLKDIAILDVCVIATGFVLRLYAGALASDVQLSHWIVIMTFLLTLFLGFAKRRNDIVLEMELGYKLRSSVKGYSVAFVDLVLGFLAAVTTVSYIMYTVSPLVQERLGTANAYLTSIFVVLGLIRYLQLALVHDKTGNPTKVLLRDRFLQACVLLWGGAFLVILY